MEHPVLLIGYNRSDYVKSRLEELSKSSLVPSKVIISLDGIATKDLQKFSDLSEVDLIRESFPFEVSLIKRTHNLGCSNHIILAVSEVLAEHESCIVIEDDVVVGKKFIGAISDALTIMEGDRSIGIAGGFSPFHKSLIPWKKNSWRLSPYFSAWGWATTSTFWKNFEVFPISGPNEEALSSSTFWNSLSARKRKIWMRRFERRVWDYNVQYTLFLHSSKVLLPKYRLIDNIGFADIRSTHTKHVRPWSLFGEGLSEKVPKSYSDPKGSSIRKFYWSFIDSNLWAADGYFSSRARSTGVRTFIKKLLKS
jgi:hypothetical protein